MINHTKILLTTKYHKFVIFDKIECFHGIYKVGGVFGIFPDKFKRRILRPQESLAVALLHDPQSQLTPEQPQKLA